MPKNVLKLFLYYIEDKQISFEILLIKSPLALLSDRLDCAKFQIKSQSHVCHVYEKANFALGCGSIINSDLINNGKKLRIRYGWFYTLY